MADSYYKLPENPEYRTEIRELQDTDPVRAETIVNPLVENILENIHAVKKEGDRHKESADHDERYYTQDEIDNKFSTMETNIDWKESVNTFADIATTYPDPDDGWTVNVKDTDYTYRWTGTEWVAISANAIPIATKDTDGKMSKEQAAKLAAVAENANNYTHPDSGATAGTYRSVTVNATGHVTEGSNPTVTVGQGGTGATTAAAARVNLGAPPTSHASTGTEYGIGSATNYGHTMASSATPLVAGTAAAGSDNGKYAREGHVHPVQTTVTGNAGTATKLQTARTISLTGDATGSVSFDGSANVTGALTLAGSGVTAGAYGPGAAASPGAGGSFNVPQITVDAKGRATSVANRAITMPANQTTITGNAGSATKLATPRSIGISGAVTGTATSFDGQSNITIPITAMNMSSATTGTLAVGRGGTGGADAAAARTNLGVPPTSHASTGTGYGVATTANYGHVKVTNGNGLAVNSGTVSMAAGSTSAVGGVQLNNTLTSTSTTQAATANSAKVLNDKITQINGNLDSINNNFFASISKVLTGSGVVTPTGGSRTSALLLSNIKSHFGTDRVVAIVTNGDAVSNNVHVHGTSYRPDVDSLYVLFDGTTDTIVRVNYVVFAIE